VKEYEGEYFLQQMKDEKLSEKTRGYELFDPSIFAHRGERPSCRSSRKKLPIAQMPGYDTR
jgi:hypothetical protein